MQKSRNFSPVPPIRSEADVPDRVTVTEKQVHMRSTPYEAPFSGRRTSGTDTSKENTLQGEPSRKQITHKLPGTKSGLPGYKRVSRTLHKVVHIATDNTIVVAYLNKEGGMKLGSLFALLWRFLTWCSRK